MANLPQSLSIDVGSFGGVGSMSSSSSSAGAPANKDRKMQSMEQLVLDLRNPNLRENALLENFKPPNLTPAQSNRVCNVLALLQCVASHPDARLLLLNGGMSLGSEKIVAYVDLQLLVDANSFP